MGVSCRCVMWVCPVGVSTCNGFHTSPSECPIGHYGYQCLQECRCENGGVCSHIDGSCGCGPGWVGTRCELGKF